MNGTRTATISLWLALTCLVGFGMFIMKNQVQSLEKELQRINSDIQSDIKSIHVLKAEWSHLNSPSRLKHLVDKHISLNPVKAEQIINYSALPFENGNFDNNRRMIARKKVGNYAEHKRNLKVYVNAQR
ncbi:MAG: hypothetical protein LBR70_07200 [Lactobacillaceae bacterium]|jgi:cell division protein FtsL|nr:hypothetical protein [Lactobacillaceae bacterium]